MINISFLNIKIFFESKKINIEGDIADNEIFHSIGSLNTANNSQLTFFHNLKFMNNVSLTNAKACFIKKEFVSLLPKTCKPIIVEDPYLCYALSSNLFNPKIISNKIISNNALIDPSSNIGKNVQINSNVIIKENCKIADNCIILENSVIGPNVEIYDSTLIMSNCVIRDSVIGSDCVIQSGVIIGDKGFGFTPQSKVEIRHVGNVIIGKNVDIGSNTTIDRGSIDSTIIRDNVRIDNLVQIAHNVIINENTIIASQTGISGSTEIGKNCIIGGQAGFAGHLKIGNNVKIAAKSGVTKNINDNSTVAGFPAIDINKWKKNIINQYKEIK